MTVCVDDIWQNRESGIKFIVTSLDGFFVNIAAYSKSNEKKYGCTTDIFIEESCDLVARIQNIKPQM